MRHLIFALIVASFSVIVPTAASAQILPIIVDETGDAPGFWWADEAHAPAGALDAALFERAERRGSDWLSPRAARTTGAVSRLFRVADISDNNALQLARLFGARTLVFGNLEQVGQPSIPWLGLQRAAWRLNAVAIDVASGANLGRVEIYRVAHGVDDATGQLAERVADALDAQVQRVSGAARGDGAVVEEEVVVIHSPDGAQPYSAFRGALREVHPGVIDVMEAWATEGWVAVRLSVDEGVTFSDIASAIAQLSGTDLGLARVVDVSVEPTMVYVDVRAGSVDGTTP